jgi:hypothetical protein
MYIFIMEIKAKPLFHKRIFWDVVFENIDYDAKANFVIERDFEKGDVEDIRNCRRYNGGEKVRDVLLHAKFLPETRMYLASAVIDRLLTDFRCYALRQSNPDFFLIKGSPISSRINRLCFGWRNGPIFNV